MKYWIVKDANDVLHVVGAGGSGIIIVEEYYG